MASSNTARLRSLPEAAERLGLSVKCLRGWVWRRRIPYIKVGRAVRISDETIQRIIDTGTMPALKECDQYPE
jgi:excisionase family DNA binding protein